MKRLAMLGAALVLSAFALAADWRAIEQSQTLLTGSLDGFLGTRHSTEIHAQHLPGYGLHISVVVPSNTPEPNETVTAFSRAMAALSGLIDGLDDGDWVSISYVGFFRYTDDYYNFHMRMKPGDPSTYEVWQDSAIVMRGGH